MRGGDIKKSRREEWEWTALIRQPDFVTPAVFAWAVEECRRKKPETDVSAARFDILEEGLCVQRMHVGPYADEPASLADLHRFIAEQGLTDCTGRSAAITKFISAIPAARLPPGCAPFCVCPFRNKKASSG